MHRILIAAAAVTALVLPACLLAGESRKITAAEVERDLVLEARLTSKRTVMPGEPVTVAVHVRNTSKSLSYPIVRPGDGSESGWREPHVFYSATVDTGDGVWRDVPTRMMGRCGLYDADWHDEVSTLAPGEKLDLKDWLSAPHHALDFQSAGRVRLLVHYRFSAGALGKGRESFGGPPPGGLGGMRGVAAFELVSAPVEFDVVRPVDVEVAVRGPVEAGRSYLLSDLLDVRLVDRERPGFRVDAYYVSLVVKPGAVQLSKRAAVEPEGKTQPAVLQPGDHVRLLGPGFAGGRDERVTFAGAGKAQVAIEFGPATGVYRLRSAWAELTVR